MFPGDGGAQGSEKLIRGRRSRLGYQRVVDGRVWTRGMCSLEPTRFSSLLLGVVVVVVATIGGSGLGAVTPCSRRTRTSSSVTVSTATPPASLLPPSSLPPATEATFTYCSPDGDELQMDFYRPARPSAVPVVLQVHGGGWVLGDRTLNVTAGLVSAFLSKGLAFATIDYRLDNAPDAIEDVACAVRYLRASAARLGIEAARIGAMGQSAGAQLVSLLGTAPPSSGFDVGQYSNESSRVQAVARRVGSNHLRHNTAPLAAHCHRFRVRNIRPSSTDAILAAHISDRRRPPVHHCSRNQRHPRTPRTVRDLRPRTESSERARTTHQGPTRRAWTPPSRRKAEPDCDRSPN